MTFRDIAGRDRWIEARASSILLLRPYLTEGEAREKAREEFRRFYEADRRKPEYA